MVNTDLGTSVPGDFPFEEPEGGLSAEEVSAEEVVSGVLTNRWSDLGDDFLRRDTVVEDTSWWYDDKDTSSLVLARPWETEAVGTAEDAEAAEGT